MYSELLLAILASVMLVLVCEIPKRHRIMLRIVFIATLIYIAALIYFVGFAYGRKSLGGVSIRFPLPFYRAIKARHYGLTTNRSVLNVILFIPFGYLMPYIVSVFKRRMCLKWWMVVGVGFLFSLLIETCQLIFRFGVFELDDLVKNTMGAAIGFGIWKTLAMVTPKRNNTTGGNDDT